MNVISSVSCVATKDEICYLFQGDWLYAAFHSALALGLDAWNKVQPSLTFQLTYKMENSLITVLFEEYGVVSGAESECLGLFPKS